MKQAGAVWKVVYVARSAHQAKSVESLLCAEGFLVRTRGALEEEPQPDQIYELLALGSEAIEVRRFLLDNNL